MTRDLSASEVSHAEADRTGSCHLLEVTFWDGSAEKYVRVTDAGWDLDVTHDFDGDGSDETLTFVAGGDLVELGSVDERADSSSGVRIGMSGLDSSIISTLLQNHFRGQFVRLWKAKLDAATGDPTDVVLLHRGMQMSDYQWREMADSENPEDSGDGVLSTKSASRLEALQATNAVRTQEPSHNAALDRAGLSTGNTHYQMVPKLPGRIFWGTDEPDPATTGENDGGSAGTGGGGGGGGGGGENGGGEELL